MEKLSKRFDWLARQLGSKNYLLGEQFTVADGYLFTILAWTTYVGFDLSKWPSLVAYRDRIGSRPKVLEALKAEGLLK